MAREYLDRIESLFDAPAMRKVRLGFLLLLLGLPVHGYAQISFTDVTPGSGIDYVGESYGASWGYANDDPLPDLFVNHHRFRAALYVNLANGTFEDREFEVNVWQDEPRSDQHGGSWADYNNDGLSDLFVTAGAANNSQFLVNNGAFLADQIANFTFDVKSWGGRMPVWFDFTNDGLLDLAISASGTTAKFQVLEQVGADFEKRNFAAGNECVNNNYGQLSDLTNDGILEWICVTQDSFPDRIYDYSTGLPFVDRSTLIPNTPNVIETQFADFNGDLLMDVYGLRGRIRVSGAEQITTHTAEAHLIDTNLNAPGVSFQTSGDVRFELHTRERAAARVFIGAAGFNPPFPGPELPIVFTLSPSDPDVEGIVGDFNSVEANLPHFVGYDSATQTWSLHTYSASGDLNYNYAYIESTEPISNLTELNLTGLDQPHSPILFQQSSGTYVDVTAAAGLDDPVSCSSVATADFDNDMDMDFYLVCRGAVSNLANIILENDGTGFFTPVAGPHGAEGPVGTGVGLGESVVVSDYDVDGFVDVFVTNGLKLYPELVPFVDGGPDKLYRNNGNANHWIELDLTGVTSNRDGIGAVVTVSAGGVSQRKEQNGGYKRWAQNDTRMHFGLGPNLTADIEVRWPSGVVDVHSAVAANALYEIVEETSIAAVAIPNLIPPSVCAATAGEPLIDQSVDREVFVWKDDCGSPDWNLLVTGGPGPTINFSGSLVSDQPLVTVTGVDLETGDILDNITDPNSVFFDLTAADTRKDGFDFTVATGSTTCFGLGSNIATALGGVNRTPLSMPFDLATGGPCTNIGPSVSIDSVSVVENDPSGVATFTVSLSEISAQTVTVDYMTVDGSAVSPGDFTAASDTLTFLSGEETQTIDIQIVDDGDPELPEQFSVVLLNPSNAWLAGANGTGTIIDNEPSACGVPVYDKATENALFVWQDCGTGLWSVRGTAGGVNTTFDGEAVSTTAFDSVTAFSVETGDVLDFVTDPSVVDFQLAVGNAGQDGFDVLPAVSASTCFDLSSPAVPVYLGANRTLITPRFSLDTLGPCVVADLETVKTLASADSTPGEGETVSFLVTVTNNGPDEATNINLTDDLPLGLTATVNNGSVSQGNYLAGSWDIGTLPAGASATLTLEGTVDAGQAGNTITNTTSAAVGDQIDPSTTGDDLSESVVIDPGLTGADLVTVKTLSSGDATPAESDVVTYLITVTNNGPAEATNVTLSDSLPAGLTPTANNGFVSQGSYLAGVWTIGSLSDSSSATLTLEGTVDLGQSGNTITNVTTAAIGDQADITDAGNDLSEEVVVDGPSETPLTVWPVQTGGVTVTGNQIVYSGVPAGWNSNTAVSQPLSTLGFSDNYEVQWIVDSDPAATTWIVGLGVDESSSNWRDVDYGLRSSGGALKIYENGNWRTNGPALVQGDVISITVNAGVVEYRINSVVVYTSAYVGQPDFYVDSSFKEGAITLSVSVVGNPESVTPPQETPIIDWLGATGGVSTVSDDVSYSGAPTGWVNNTLNSVLLSSLGVGDTYAVQWTIGSDPTGTLWVFGLGVTESSADWRDVDYALRSSSGVLTVYENGNWVTTSEILSVGDVLSIHVEGTQLEYRFNGAVIASSAILGTEDFYIDSSFKQGAIDLSSVTLIEPN